MVLRDTCRTRSSPSKPDSDATTGAHTAPAGHQGGFTRPSLHSRKSGRKSTRQGPRDSPDLFFRRRADNPADIAELVNYARTTGFQKVSITTNGRMFSYPKFADLMLKAGLTGVSVSLHGPTAEIHESLTMVPGSFEQACRNPLPEGKDGGIRGRIRHHDHYRARPRNIDLLRETLLLAQEHGATVHRAAVHPFKENLARGARFLLGIDRIVAGIHRACGRASERPGQAVQHTAMPAVRHRA